MRVRQAERGRVQPQALHAQVLSPPAVVCPLAMGRITDDGVRQVLEVAPDLVPSTGVRQGLDQGHAGLRVAVHRHIKAAACQQAEIGHGVLRWRIGWRVIGAQGVVHMGLFRWPAAHHRHIALEHLSALEAAPTGAWPHRVTKPSATRPRCPCPAGESGCTGAPNWSLSVWTTKRVSTRVQACAVHQPAGRLVDGEGSRPLARAPARPTSPGASGGIGPVRIPTRIATQMIT